MSTKGMSNTAARKLVDELSRRGVSIYVLHDFDKSGFSILHTLRTDTRRYRFTAQPKVFDLGLTLADVQAMDLQSEPYTYKQSADPKIDLARCGASPEEQAFLVDSQRRHNYSTDRTYWTGKRVEINAMTSDQFVAWIDQRLSEEHVTKVVPSPGTLARTYRLAMRTKANNTKIAQIQETMHQEPIALPLGDLAAEVSWALQQTPARSWDEAVWAMIDDERSPGVTRDDERCW